MFLKHFDKFFSKFQKYFFTYKDGFFVFTFTANSPQAMLDSLGSMPFVDVNYDQCYIKTKNPIFNSSIYHNELEDGLSIHFAENECKANLNFKLLYDKDLPAENYFLNLFINKVRNNKLQPTVNGFSYTNRSWSFFKPRVSNSVCHFKNTSGIYVTVYFTQTWINNYLCTNKKFINSGINKFIESKNNYIIWPDLLESTDDIYKPFESIFKSIEMDSEQKKKELHILTINFIDHFFQKYDSEKIEDDHFQILDSERIKILKVEKLIIENLFKSFTGIEILAQEIGMSPTKLKINFKLIFGMTIYQYYMDKRMKFAHEKLINNQLKIKEVSAMLGYENQGKFSLAFKNQFGYLPSNIKQ